MSNQHSAIHHTLQKGSQRDKRNAVQLSCNLYVVLFTYDKDKL